MKIIASKMSIIMSECQYLQKQGVNEFHNYRFVQANDVIKAVIVLYMITVVGPVAF